MSWTVWNVVVRRQLAHVGDLPRGSEQACRHLLPESLELMLVIGRITQADSVVVMVRVVRLLQGSLEVTAMVDDMREEYEQRRQRKGEDDSQATHSSSHHLLAAAGWVIHGAHVSGQLGQIDRHAPRGAKNLLGPHRAAQGVMQPQACSPQRAPGARVSLRGWRRGSPRAYPVPIVGRCEPDSGSP